MAAAARGIRRLAYGSRSMGSDLTDIISRGCVIVYKVGVLIEGGGGSGAILLDDNSFFLATTSATSLSSKTKGRQRLRTHGWAHHAEWHWMQKPTC